MHGYTTGILRWTSGSLDRPWNDPADQVVRRSHGGGRQLRRWVVREGGNGRRDADHAFGSGREAASDSNGEMNEGIVSATGACVAETEA